MNQSRQVRIAIVSSTFRAKITRALEGNCVRTLVASGVSKNRITIVHVPGSLEIPFMAQTLARKRRYDAIITFGVILKGKTYHFEQIANECARGCMDVSLRHNIPVIFEVLAVYDLSDAAERATRKRENKGIEGAKTALEMIRILSTV
jgi:6,7-dimethyl-8-ribityllumazine synthase